MTYVEYEYCPRCEANLTLQKGYRNSLPYWFCRGCGELLINPDVESDSDIVWFCDECGAMLNIQQGFSENVGEWVCTECGFSNTISESDLYLSEDEYQASLNNPYLGLSDEDVFELSLFQEIGLMNDRQNIALVRHCETEMLCVRKFLTTYNKSIYEYVKAHPVSYMPNIIAVYEGKSSLIVIEEYISGATLADILQNGPLSEKQAVYIAQCIVHILKVLHSLPRPIIHRDVKPSNIIITGGNEVYLLDMNVAKWYNPEQTADTRYLGTKLYASPEQAGYGLSASSAKSDIYAVGMLLNVMLTGRFPKEQRAAGRIWDIIARCIDLKAEDRYTDEELIEALDALA